MIRCRRGSTLRSAALIALAAFGVHQLRYLLAYGSSTHEELARQGHAYLSHALPILAGFAVAALAAGLLRAAAGERARSAIANPRLRSALYAASVFLVFAAQESVEGLMSGGHASGLGAVFAAGGWLALPLAALFGCLCALLDGGLARLESIVARRRAPVPRPRPPRRQPAFASPVLVPRASLPLAFGIARRPPPLAA
jgi:hypothetical protein